MQIQLNRPKPLILCILDGWGHREERTDNAIAAARTPHWHDLLASYPHGLINASELHVGLPSGQMGNSEVGHMNIGSGRVVMQDLPRIDAAIADNSIPNLSLFKNFIANVRGTVHLLGLASDGGVHAHIGHMEALARYCAQAGKPVRVHAILDGRDTPPQSAQAYIRRLESVLATLPDSRIATVSGRYYAMDRDKRWERVKLAYQCLTQATAPRYDSAEACLAASYSANVTDEFVIPSAIGDYTGMGAGDGLLMANFRADRAREILQALLDSEFSGFDRGKRPRLGAALGMAEYAASLTPLIPPLFPPEPLTHILGEVIAEAGLTQLRIAETEKYAHVTFFFNAGRETPYAGEERILIPSPQVATYDEKPEMAAFEVTDALVEAIASGRFDVVVVNYANTDMVGHTGDLEAAKKAVEAVDTCLGRIVAAAHAAGGGVVITADHGNAETMFDHGTGQPHTAHTLNMVPLVLALPQWQGSRLSLPTGRLGDIAPTLLELLGIPQPPGMTGRSLLPRHAA